MESRRMRANEVAEGDHYHPIATRRRPRHRGELVATRLNRQAIDPLGRRTNGESRNAVSNGNLTRSPTNTTTVLGGPE
jgi:hypothetical protein